MNLKLARQKQTIFGDDQGNCYTACVASALRTPLKELPNLCHARGDWMLAANRTMRKFGVALFDIRLDQLPLSEWSALSTGVPVILSGKSPRGDFSHAVLGEYVLRQDGMHQFRYVHDPHPDDTFLDGIPRFATLLLHAPQEQQP